MSAVRYTEVVHAATETATKILLARVGYAGRVRITVDGGSTASVNWSGMTRGRVTINLPSLPPEAMLTRGEADRLVGYIAHECCHVIHSDWYDWTRAVSEGPRIRYWVNAMEDVRIEASEIRARHFPNLRNLLATVLDKHHFDALIAARKGGYVIGTRMAHAPYCVLMLGRMRNGYVVPTAKGFEAGITGDCRVLVDEALAGLKGCKNSYQILVLARRLVAMEQAMTPPPQPQPDQDQGDQDQGDQGDQDQGDQDQGDQGDQDDQDQDSPQDGAGDPDEGQDGDQDQDSPQDGAGDASEGDGDPDQGDQEISGDQDLDQLVRDVAKRTGIEDMREWLTGDKSHQLTLSRSQTEPGPRCHPTESLRRAGELTAMLPGNAVLHGQISRLLVSEETHRVTHHETSGRLDRRALVRMGTGAPDVFSRRDDTPGVNTAVLILVDGSSSMNLPVGNLDRIRVAQCAAWHIGKAAEDAGAKCTVVQFRSLIGGRNGNGAQLTVRKGWDQTMADAAGSIGSMGADDYTPMSPAIIEAAGMLANETGHDVTRRIMLVITDGECDYGANGVRSACAIAADLGVETVGIGMACESVIAAFPPAYSVNVADLDQLATRGLGVLVDMLEDAAGGRGAD